MASESKPGTLAKIGPVGAPALGVILLVVFVALAMTLGDVRQESDRVTSHVRDLTARLGSSAAQRPAPEFPPAGDVLKAFTPRSGSSYTIPQGEDRATGLPTGWHVRIAEPDVGIFARFDADGDGRWVREEFDRSPFPTSENELERKFENWDRDGDGAISKEEFGRPPQDENQKFDELDVNKDGDSKDHLTADEITEEQLREWDWFIKDGRVSRYEFVNRYNKPTLFNLGQARSVAAAVDIESMAVIVTWQAPAVESAPDDLQYVIRRFSPETLAAREAAYRQRAAAYASRNAEWTRGFERWWQGENRERLPAREAAETEYAGTNPRPVQPEAPDRWETVATVSGTEYRDTSFEAEITYTYSVEAFTEKTLYPASKPARVVGERKFAAPALQAGHPIIVRNVTAMAWNSAGTSDMTVTLSRWHKHVDESGAEPVHTWYRVSIRERVETAAPDVGGNYTLAQLKDRSVQFNLPGQEVAVEPETLLAPNARLNFATGFRFVGNSAGGSLFNHPTYGDFELPRLTGREAAQPQAAPATDSKFEVRAMAVRPRGDEATMEITHWVQAGGEWLRVELTRTVRRGDEVGARVNLAETVAGVRVFDSSGQAVDVARRRTLGAGTVDLSVGTFDGLEGRTLKVGGAAFDLFGALFK